VTPSGHICLKRLLLAKLAENGGVDPFSGNNANANNANNTSTPLALEQLIALKLPTTIVPPRPAATSMPNILSLLQQEYDALALELFDTRAALEETRQELSQALYQNDAAVRVVARTAAERDAARQELAQYAVSASASGGVNTTTNIIANTATVATTAGEPEPKKRRLQAAVAVEEERELPLTNDIPAADLATMVAAWETLHGARKARQKQAALVVPAPQALARALTETDSKSIHKTSNKGILALAACPLARNMVTAGKDKQLVVYDTATKVVAHTVAGVGKGVTCLDINETYFVAGMKDAKEGGGRVTVFSVSDAAEVGSYDTSAPVVDVRLHPDGVHVCIASHDGTIAVCAIASAENVAPVAIFEAPSETAAYTAGALHHDGLIYVAGTATGDVLVWDFRSKTLAATLKEGDAVDAVTAVEFSSNGYHLAVAYKSGLVRVWDLRKQNVIATLNETANADANAADGKLLKSVDTVGFDDSGKYLAFGGSGGMRITTVKEWGITAAVDAPLVSGLAWGTSLMVACSEKQRNVTFYGASE